MNEEQIRDLQKEMDEEVAKVLASIQGENQNLDDNKKMFTVLVLLVFLIFFIFCVVLNLKTQ